MKSEELKGQPICKCYKRVVGRRLFVDKSRCEVHEDDLVEYGSVTSQVEATSRGRWQLMIGTTHNGSQSLSSVLNATEGPAWEPFGVTQTPDGYGTIYHFRRWVEE